MYYPPDRRWPVSIWLAPLRLRLQMQVLVSTTLALYDSCLWIEPMGTNIAIGHLPTSPLKVHPDSLTVHITRLRLWATFQVMGA